MHWWVCARLPVRYASNPALSAQCPGTEKGSAELASLALRRDDFGRAGSGGTSLVMGSGAKLDLCSSARVSADSMRSALRWLSYSFFSPGFEGLANMTLVAYMPFAQVPKTAIMGIADGHGLSAAITGLKACPVPRLSAVRD